MTQAEWLYVIVAALYAAECLFKVRRDATVLATSTGYGWRIAPVYRPASGADWGLTIEQPLPFGSSLATNDWPISFGAVGALGYVARCHSPGGRLPQSGLYIEYDDVQSVTRDGCRVVVDGQLLIEAADERTAAICRDLLEALSQIPTNERPARIRQSLDDSLSIETVDARIDQFRAATYFARLGGFLLFFGIFVGGALLLWVTESRVYWPAWLLLLVLGQLLAVFGTLRAPRALGLNYRRFDSTWQFLVTAILSPLAAARGAPHLARHVLDGMHPVACAIALLPRPTWSLLARRWLRDLAEPLEPVCDHPDMAARVAEAEYRHTVREGLIELLGKFDWDETVECPLPTPEADDCASYCPRCLAQFTAADARCANCGDKPTVAFSLAEALR